MSMNRIRGDFAVNRAVARCRARIAALVALLFGCLAIGSGAPAMAAKRPKPHMTDPSSHSKPKATRRARPDSHAERPHSSAISKKRQRSPDPGGRPSRAAAVKANKRLRELGPGENANNGDPKDHDFKLGSNGTKIDEDSKPTRVETKLHKGWEVTTFETKHGVKGTARRKDNVLETEVTGMKKLPSGTRAPTGPAPGHITYHSVEKGPKSGRKYSPKDQASVHIAGPASHGVPGTTGAYMTVDGSSNYNRQHSLGHERKLRNMPQKRKWAAKTRVELEPTNSSDRVNAIAHEYSLDKKGKQRLQRRMNAVVKKNPQARSVRSMETTYTSDHPGDSPIMGKYGRDFDHHVKPGWLKPDYNSGASSGDEDIEKGKPVHHP